MVISLYCFICLKASKLFLTFHNVRKTLTFFSPKNSNMVFHYVWMCYIACHVCLFLFTLDVSEKVKFFFAQQNLISDG